MTQQTIEGPAPWSHGGILRTVSEPCWCCGGAECCAYSGTPSYSIPSGFSLEGITCQNDNPYNCVGEHKCTIKLSKAASPGMTCASQPCKHSSRCGTGSIPASVITAFWGAITGNLTNYQQASAYSGPSVAGCFSPCNPPAGLVSSCCFDLLFGDTYSTSPCVCPPNPSAPNNRTMLFEYKGINSGNIGCINPNTYCMTNYWAPEVATIHGALYGNPVKVTTYNAGTGYTCEWWLWGASAVRNQQATNNVCYTSTYTTCSNIDNICDHRVQWIQVHCAVKCNQNPCSGVTGPSWDMELPCSCQGHYAPPDPSAEPVCKLYLYDTRGPNFEGDKCMWEADYGGAIEAGITDCDSTPEDDDCVCCGAGGTS